MLALVDNRVPVRVVMRHDTHLYRFDLGYSVPAKEGLYLVECLGSDLPCQHVVHESRILLCPNEEA
jgi:hypothetical protein